MSSLLPFDRTEKGHCVRCGQPRPLADFMHTSSAKSPHRQPLGELDPNVENGTKKYKMCVGCQDAKRKTKASDRKHKKKKLDDKNWLICSWTALYSKIDDGYGSSHSTVLIISVFLILTRGSTTGFLLQGSMKPKNYPS